ncbi:TetR/AcrR family transcriptional regulator [Muricauda sp. 334s03]|uniref:TetR/AcrR family transcriptional regulator n=1 Tax=Flagellimonas yonaguniensis TaxID=3031325 RepID=A0ABT5XUS6_9FLAO|nr:TetR/AcrR family transcriptional regulator [[Muricauda] yonaguniensis]MDF0714939.1 TetR/AcrR family transcriptional regulator [[Muricauda] yonaguniensis]
MARSGKPTRDKILAESKDLVFQNGFSGTSIDQILEKAGITKGAFFYHFKTKNALAKALIEEFALEDIHHMNAALTKTEGLNGDSLSRLLQFIQEFINMMSGLGDPYSCLYASYLYEPNQFDQDILDQITDTLLTWRKTMEKLINNVLKEYEPQMEIDVQSLADHILVIFEGAFIISKGYKGKDLTAEHLKHLKNYFTLLFCKKK